MIFLILGLLIGGLTVIFISQNVIPVSVFFFTWELHGSLAVVLIISVLIGAVLAVLSCLSELIEDAAKIKSLQKYVSTLEEENRVLHNKVINNTTTIL